MLGRSSCPAASSSIVEHMTTCSGSLSQDAKARIMTFTLKPGSGGLMRQFEGTWYVKPDPSGSAGKGPSTIATLRQKIMPLISGPGLDWIVTGDAAVPVSSWNRVPNVHTPDVRMAPVVGHHCTFGLLKPGVRQLMKTALHRHLQTAARQPCRGSQAGGAEAERR